MATRTFKRNAKGQFAVSDSRTGKGGRKLSPEQKAARAASDEVRQLKQQRAVQKADEQVDAAAASIKSADAEYKRAKRVGSDDVLDAAWTKRLAAHTRYAAALRRRAKAGQ